MCYMCSSCPDRYPYLAQGQGERGLAAPGLISPRRWDRTTSFAPGFPGTDRSRLGCVGIGGGAPARQRSVLVELVILGSNI